VVGSLGLRGAIIGMTNRVGAHESVHIGDAAIVYRSIKVCRNTGILPVLGDGRLDRRGRYRQEDLIAVLP
jgi:hypothetical protein